MPADDPLLDELADAILDGTPIDWTAIESRAGGHGPLLVRLRALSALANVHRDPASASSAPGEEHGEPFDAVHRRDGHLGHWRHLRLVEAIGSGAFGRVYRARDTRLDRDVALKLLPASLSGGRRASSIIEEGRLLAQVRHPNVVTIYGADRIGDQVGLWMERVEGRTLEQILEQGRRFTVKQVVEIGIQLCGAVSAVHEAGLLHRDIKSHNVMLATDGRIVLMDFGTVWDIKDNLHAAPAGTPLYLAPEVLDGEAATVRSDIYALGVLLFHLLTGAYPIAGHRLRDLRDAHHRDPRVDLQRVRPDVPWQLENVIGRAIDPQPERRYESGAAMAAHLRSQQRRVAAGAWAALVFFTLVVALLVAVPVFRVTSRSSGGSPVSAPSALTLTPVTSTPGRKAHPALSPDGSRLAFCWWDANGESEIYVKELTSGRTTQITRTVGGENYLAWSPDGRFLAFSRLFRNHDGQQSGAVLIVPTEGGAERTLWQGRGALLGHGVDWSPDGRQIAVSMKPSLDKPRRLVLIDVRNLEKRWITDPPASTAGDSRPAFAPDGASLAFVRNTASASRLHILHLAAAELATLPTVGHDIRGITWGDGGRTLVFTSYKGGGRDRLWRISTSGGEAEPVPGIGEGASFPSAARTGGRLVFLQQLLDSNLYVADLSSRSGATARQLAPSTRADTSPDFSPDGSRIAFASNRTGAFEIWLVDRDGGNLRQLTDLGTRCRGPRWSPDGQRIVFSASPSTTLTNNLYVADASTGVSYPITSGTSEDQWPTWSVDGKSIYFGSNRGGTWQIWRVSTAAEEPVQLTRDNGAKAWESSDGRFLYFSNNLNNTPAIWRMPVAGGEPTLVFRLPDETAWGGEWVLTVPGIYWLNDRATPRPAIEFFAFGTAASVRAVTPEGRYNYGSGFAVSKDGRSVVFAQMDYHGTEIMMIEDRPKSQR